MIQLTRLGQTVFREGELDASFSNGYLELFVIYGEKPKERVIRLCNSPEGLKALVDLGLVEIVRR